MPTKVIGHSLDNLKKLVIEFAQRGKNVLFVGPSGTGKELFAQLYTENCEKENMVAFNCSAFHESNLHAELFGHKKGSFTGAVDNRSGILSRHHKKSVIFFDELGDSSHSFQAALLRVLQSGDYRPFGSDDLVTIKPELLTVIGATSKPDKIRNDLKNRFTILYIPPMGYRYEENSDIPELLFTFCSDLGIESITEDALKTIKSYPWPGNVRQLKNVVEEADALRKLRGGQTLNTNDLISITHRQDENDQSQEVKFKGYKEIATPLPYDIFLSPKATEPHLESDEQKMQADEKEHNEKMENALKSISYSISDVRSKISECFGPDSPYNQKDTNTDQIYNELTPKEYESNFYAYHASRGVGGTDLERLFNGKINNKTATRNLKKYKPTK
jgi:transcriptional regulator with GAF, ATPase, and Fis domain